MLERRTLLLALPFFAAACASGDPEALPPLVTGYRHLTPIRLNVAEIEVPSPDPASIRVDEAAPIRPEQEMLRMAQERLSAAGTENQARFLVQTADFLRAPLAGQGGLAGLFTGDPGERLSVRLQARLEIVSAEGRRVGFVEADVRRQRSLPDGSTAAERRRAAEEIVRQAMDDLNVEFEFQVRRNLRPWLAEAGGAPVPIGPGGIEREELRQGEPGAPAAPAPQILRLPRS